MKRHLIIISILSLIFIHSGFVYSATIGDCQESSEDDAFKYRYKKITPASDLIINTGIGENIDFTPDAIEIIYDFEDTNCESPTGYHAQNGDSTNYSAGEIETNISYNKGGLSSLTKFKNRISSQRYYSDSISSSILFTFTYNHNVTITTKPDTGQPIDGQDPFNGRINNREILVKNKLKFGTDAEPCQEISRSYDLDGTPYSELYPIPNDMTQIELRFSLKGLGNTACPLEVEFSNGSRFYGNAYTDERLRFENISDKVQFRVTSTNKTWLEYPLYRSKADIGSPDKIVMTMRWDLDGYFFWDNAGNLIRLTSLGHTHY